MQTCTRCNTLNSDDAAKCKTCQADLREVSATAVTLKRFQKNPRVKNVRLVVSADACPACQQHSGTYEKGKIPSLPIEGCSHENGCRCNYEPMFDEIYP